MRWWLDHLHAWQAHETDFLKLRQEVATLVRRLVPTSSWSAFDVRPARLRNRHA